LSSPVVLDNDRMVNGYVRRAPFEVTHRISALQHQLAHESIRSTDDTCWIVDEAGLQSLPLLRKAGRLARRQGNEVQALHSQLARSELSLRLVLIAQGADNSLVLGAEALAEVSGLNSPSLADHEKHRDDDRYREQNRNDDRVCVHV